MRNKNGFTLIELLSVIAVIGIISLIAIPNIIGLSIGIRKDNMLDDAKKMISLAKSKINSDISLRSNPPKTFTLAQLNVSGVIEKDPDGGEYDKTNSKVKYQINQSNNTAEYCVILIGSKRSIGSASNCVKEENLYSRSNVVDNVEEE